MIPHDIVEYKFLSLKKKKLIFLSLNKKCNYFMSVKAKQKPNVFYFICLGGNFMKNCSKYEVTNLSSHLRKMIQQTNRKVSQMELFFLNRKLQAKTP